MVSQGSPKSLVRVRFLPPLPRSVHFVHKRSKHENRSEHKCGLLQSFTFILLVV